jgi:exopolysaccharide biosynthesis polyprenyl glycosylphosphotransferase
MAGQEGVLIASGAEAELEPTFVGEAHEVQGLSAAHTSFDALTSIGTARTDFLENSPTIPLNALDVVGEEIRHLGTSVDQAAVPARNRFTAWSRRYLMILATADALIGGTAAALPASISDTLSGRSPAPAGHTVVPVLCLIGLAVWPAAIALRRGYRRDRIGVGFDELRAVMRAGSTVVVAGALPVGFMAIPTGESTMYALLKLVVCSVPLAVVFSLAARFLARKVLHSFQRNGRNLRHIVVAGSFAAVQQLTERIQREPYGGMKVVGSCLPAEELPRPVVDGIPVLGNLHQVAEVVQKLGCDAVAVTSDDATRYNYLRELAWSLEGAGVELLVDPGLVEVAGPRMHIRPLMGFPLVHVEEPHFTGWRRLVKRVSDLVLGSIGLIVIAPVMLAIAVVIKLQDGGPVIFRQGRVGRSGELFTMLKFRSMVPNAEARKLELIAHNEGNGGLFKMRDDPRITPFGGFLRKFSLDELPQLFNVLAGSMSLVGPRPHLPDELALMPSEASRRSLVTPGLTGLWQVSGRSNLEGDDAIRLDLRYVENWSFTLDLLILWKTISAVLAKRGAS